jgi:hypothetical protein
MRGVDDFLALNRAECRCLENSYKEIVKISYPKAGVSSGEMQ